LKGYLLDTNILSMTAPTGVQAPGGFLDWLDRMDAEGRVFLSVVAVHEIEKGVALLEHRGALRKAASLRAWLVGLLAAYSDKIISFDASAAEMAGRLEARAIASGHDPGMADAMVAGLAAVHDLVIITRNTRHFLPFGVAVAAPETVAS
jgi:predicted nucleic acid-binding protein